MSGLDAFAWIVLLVLVASSIVVFCILGWLPGHVAKSRNHPAATAVQAAGWITLLCGFALWPIATVSAVYRDKAPFAFNSTIRSVEISTALAQPIVSSP